MKPSDTTPKRADTRQATSISSMSDSDAARFIAALEPVSDRAERVRLLQKRALKAGFRPSADPAAEKAVMDDLSGEI